MVGEGGWISYVVCLKGMGGGVETNVTGERSA